MIMKDILKMENVKITDSVKDWKEAIEISVQPLIQQGYCEERYIAGIIENTQKFGPYYVLCENLALIHGRSEQGVIKTQLAITVLKQPVKFRTDGYNVRVLIALAAQDSKSHLEAMQAISNIFSDNERVQKILEADKAEIIYDLIVSSVEE